MPYKTMKELPPQVQNLPAGAKDIWFNAFNAAAKQYPEETQAFATAWSAVKKKYKKQGAMWVLQKSGGAGGLQKSK